MKWALALLMMVCACVRHPPPAPPRTTKFQLPIKHFELPNGLKVVLVEDPKATEVQVTMRYRVGAIDDPAGQEGTAHLVEHLMFQQVLGAQSLFAQLESVASYFNAFTSFDGTTYVTRARREHLETLLSIEAVRVGFRCTSITDVVFERERSVVINEVRQRDRVSDLLETLHRGTYPENHPYRRTIAGTEQSVGAITREQACAFADAHYATKNAVLVVSGDVTTEQLGAALQKFLGRVPARPVQPRREVPTVTFTGARASVPGPVDDEALIVMWPLPRDPTERAKFRTVIDLATSEIDSKVKGKVLPVQLGDVAAPTRGVVVVLASDETIDQAIAGVTKGIEAMTKDLDLIASDGLGGVIYDRIRQAALHDVFAGLQDGSDRDSRLATAVLAGADPRVALAGELLGVRELTKAELIRIAREQLAMSLASITILKPRLTGPRSEVQVTPPVHDLASRRDPPDPATAHRPLERDLGARRVEVTTRTLPNGLQVVLLPGGSISTVDIRLVFHAGTADDPVNRSGTAVVAARGLTWQTVHLNDLLLFAAAGGFADVDVDADRTEWLARGMDMHLDVLLAGLRRIVRDGWYGGASSVLKSIRARAHKSRETDSLDDAWLTALYGTNHPYVTGSGRSVSRALHGTDIEQFRIDHFNPDNATLIIAGGFDPAIADRWIDFLFGDWTGTSVKRQRPSGKLAPVSLARDVKGSLVSLAIALPATRPSRAEQLVLAEMLSGVVFDVREQLGASYDLAARLDEERLSSRYRVSGLVDATRTADAMALIRDRLAQLRTDSVVAARAFARARAAVATRLAAITNHSTALASRVSRDFALGRAPLSDLDTAAEVRKLTLASIDLGELAIERAAIQMRGPAAEIDRAFAALGRTPMYVKPSTPQPKSDDDDDDELRVTGRPDSSWSLSLPLTYQGPRRRMQLGLAIGYTFAAVDDLGVRGMSVMIDAGYRVNRKLAFGGQFSLGGLYGQYPTSHPTMPEAPIRDVPVGLYGAVQTWGDRLFGGLGVGLRFDRITDNTKPPIWQTAPAIALQFGVDLLRMGEQQFTLLGRGDVAALADRSIYAFTLAGAWRW